MNILFLTSSSYSHIICLKNVIKHLVNRKETIFCMSTPENQKILEEFGAKFISYPDSIIPVSIRKEIMEQLDSAEMRSIKKDDIRKWYDIALEKDIEMLYDMTEDQVSKLEKIILDNHIDIIFCKFWLNGAEVPIKVVQRFWNNGTSFTDERCAFFYSMIVV